MSLYWTRASFDTVVNILHFENVNFSFDLCINGDLTSVSGFSTTKFALYGNDIVNICKLYSQKKSVRKIKKTKQINMIPQILNNVNTSNSITKKKERKTCIVCYDAKNTHLCVPCGHQCFCKDCSKQINELGNKCPICRANVSQIIKVYT